MKLFAALIFASLCTVPAYATQPEKQLDLVVLHTNDTHSYVAGRDKYGNACVQSANCVGGMGRISTVAHEKQNNTENVLLLDAGDQFQGTLFYTVNKNTLLTDMNTLVPYDAMTLGNHEFDEGCPPLADFIHKNPFPVLAANLIPEPGCPLREAPIKPFIIRTIHGVQVGIAGLANPNVTTLAAPCPQTRFLDSAQALREAVTTLNSMGVRHIIAITHLGLDEDRKLARSVDGVDVIVGGHTHTFLGSKPEDGPYPIVEQAPSGQPVLVVTAGFGTEYLGELHITFDAQGVPLRWNGAPIRLETSVSPDPAVESKVATYATSLTAFYDTQIGTHDVLFADGMQDCRKGDCLSGMLVTDAMLDYARPYGATIALVNGGSLRAPLKRGVITQGDLLAVLPFGNKLVIREYTGEQILAALEQSMGVGDVSPRLLQPAGLRYRYDRSRPLGQRISSAEIIDEKGVTNNLDTTARYAVVLIDFLARGGDAYAMLAQGRVISAPDPLDVDIVSAYITKHNPLTLPVAGRIISVR